MDEKYKFAVGEIALLMDDVLEATKSGAMKWDTRDCGEHMEYVLADGRRLEVDYSGCVSVRAEFEGEHLFCCEGCPCGIELYHAICREMFRAEVDAFSSFVASIPK